jgi:hypothetical protein
VKILAIFVGLCLWLPSNCFACNTADLIEQWNSAGGPVGLNIAGRPSTQYDWVTPDGRFHIHYDLTGDNAVYHPDEDINPPDGIPDYVNRTADYLALSYDSMIVAIGFDPPPYDNGEGGDSLYDVYLTDNPGLTTPEAPSFQYPGHQAYSSFIQLGHDLRYPSRYGDDPYPFLKASVSHEYFHAIEFAYRAYSTDYTPWWFEACANWAEERVFDDVNDVYYSLPDYFSNPQYSLYHTSGRFLYGTWLFPEYLDERFGPQFILNCWEKFASYDFAQSAIALALGEIGASLNFEFCSQVVWNYFTGTNYQSGFYQEGADFDTTVYVAQTHSIYPVGWLPAPEQLQNMSSSYIVFERDDNIKSTLVIDYDNPSLDKQAVCLAIIRPDSPVQYNVYNIVSGVMQTFVVSNFSMTDKVVMIPIWLYETNPKEEFSTYQYHAYLRDTLTDVTDNGALPISNYTLNSAYPNPFNGAVSISFNAPVSNPYKIQIYDIIGRNLFQLDGIAHSGINTLTWQAPTDLASGVLFYVIDIDQKKLDGKISLLK